EAEYRSFISNKKNEALHSRMIVMPIPYNLKLDQEERIYLKMIEESDIKDVHIAPHALKVAAMFTILTRLKESKQGNIGLLKKLYLYNHQDVEGFSEQDVDALKKEFSDEGMSGIDPRYVINRISSTIIRKEMQAINALDVLRSLKDGLDDHPSITKEHKEDYLEFISMARKEYDELAKKEVQKAFVYSYDESAKTLMDNY